MAFIETIQKTITSIPNMSYEPFGGGLSLAELVFALILWIASGIAVYLVRRLVLSRLHAKKPQQNRTASSVALDFVAALPSFLFIAISLYAPAIYLAAGTAAASIIHGIALVAGLFYGLRLGLAIVDRFARISLVERDGDERGDETTYSLVMMGVRVFAFMIAALLLLSNFWVEVTPLLASLGVGGIAVAFAMQNILADIFASISIYFDRPFKIGDYITIGNDSGIVRKVGLKTTRIRTLEGQELVVANKELANVRINNYATLERRRVLFTLSISSETPREKVAQMNEFIAVAAAWVKRITLDRTHLVAVKSSAFDFEIAYFVESSQHLTYLDARQAFLLEILAMLDREEIKMA